MEDQNNQDSRHILEMYLDAVKQLCILTEKTDLSGIEINKLLHCIIVAGFGVEKMAADERTEKAISYAIKNAFEKHKSHIFSITDSAIKEHAIEFYICSYYKNSDDLKTSKDVMDMCLKVVELPDGNSEFIIREKDSCLALLSHMYSELGDYDKSSHYFGQIKNVSNICSNDVSFLLRIITEQYPEKSLELLKSIKRNHPDLSLKYELAKVWLDHPILDVIDLDTLSLIGNG